MIARWIDWCARNRFLVFTGTLFLALAGIYCMKRVPLDALPDISDVEVIIHTSWAGEPPNIIEDQVTYPIVTALLAAPRVKAVRAQTMFGDSYVFVVFQDGTDLYWARSRVIEYLQEIAGQLPANVHPAIGPDATGAGWVYEMCSSTKPIDIALPISARYRTGSCAISLRPFRAWRKSRASAVSCGNTRCGSIRTNSVLITFRFLPSLIVYKQAPMK